MRPPSDADRELRVLVVEDDPDFLLTLKAFLESKFPGWRIVPAATPAEGLAAVRRGGIEAVVSDYDLPTMTGVELLAAVQKLAPDVARMLLTAHPTEDALAARRQRLVSDVISKLVAPDELARRLGAACAPGRGAG